MSPDFIWPDGLGLDIQYGYLDPKIVAPKRHNPRIVLNTEGTSVLRTLREELARSDSFLFSVAFVTPRAIALLKQEFVDFRGTGRIVTSDYLAFNRPAAFEELLNLRQVGVDVRFHPAAAFHPKGYIFTQRGTVTAMVGSSNLTENALVQNYEWNLKVSATDASNLGHQLTQLIDQQLAESQPLTPEWIAEYAKRYIPPPSRPRRPTTEDAEEEPPPPDLGIQPNTMQRDALAAIAEVRAAGHDRAIVISATGTGKTILSALDVQAVDPVRLLFVVHREQILDKTITEYRKVLGGSERDYGKLTGSAKQAERRYLFATVQTLSQPDVLNQLNPRAFEYLIIDEAHRAASASYQRVLEHFTPEFTLGMTATPERMDGINVFELFDYNVPYEIRLGHALEADMLAPFHYYGVADLTVVRDQTTSGPDLDELVSPERVDHIISTLEIYGQASQAPRGLIFCSRRDEAHALSTALNARTLRGQQLRTVALTGADSVSYREDQVEALERGELDYLLTVDVFNEGVDIPAINQVVMLRQTQSAVVFVQQLGRGLRKADGKEYLVVIDFIGNYANNYLIPVALFGDESLNKESLRQKLIAAEESGVLAGQSSIRFDRIAQERVLRSISEAKLDSMQNIKKSVDVLRNRLGRMPLLQDFVKFESTDPVLLATKDRSYPAVLKRLYRTYDAGLSDPEHQALHMLSHEVLTARRLHEQELVRHLLQRRTMAVDEVAQAFAEAEIPASRPQILSAIDTLTLERHAEADLKRYGQGIASFAQGRVELDERLFDSYRSRGRFAHEVDDLLDTARTLVSERYAAHRTFTPGWQYSRKEVTRLLTMPRKWTSTLYGYRVDLERGVCPIFVTLHKSEDVHASVAYADELLDPHTMLWYTRSRRALASPEVQAITANDVALHVFVKKDDAEGTNFYYLGQATAANPEQTTMPGKAGERFDVVRMLLRFDEPIDSALYDYFHPQITN